MKEDKVTDEQVRGVTLQVNRLTSRLVNKLCVKEDKVTWRVNRLTSRWVNRLRVKEDRVTDEQVRGVTWQVDKLTS